MIGTKQVDVSLDTIYKINELAEEYKLNTVNDILKDSVNMYEKMLIAKRAGDKLYVKDEDGCLKPITFL